MIFLLVHILFDFLGMHRLLLQDSGENHIILYIII